MSDDATDRLKLPLLQPGQAQKEIFHNEALALLDLAVQPAVTAFGIDVPPVAPLAGQSWIVGTAPTGAWAGRARALAGWTAGGWRFVDPVEGMTAWIPQSRGVARFSGGAWALGAIEGSTLVLDNAVVVRAQRAAIADVSGGQTIDAEARAVIAAILAALRGHGLIAT